MEINFHANGLLSLNHSRRELCQEFLMRIFDIFRQMDLGRENQEQTFLRRIVLFIMRISFCWKRRAASIN